MIILKRQILEVNLLGEKRNVNILVIRINLCWEEGGSAWVQRRRLIVWEEESVTKCTVLLYDIVLQDNIFDRWRWLLDPINGYSVKGTYHYLMPANTPHDQGLLDDVWHKQVPLKVSLFIWRLLRNWLPTKDNLVRRHIIIAEDNTCMGGCGSWETADHLLFCCDSFSSVWFAVLQWLRLSFVVPGGFRDHFTHFGHIAGLPRSSYPFLQLIWMVCVWVIWKEQNNKVFHQKITDSQTLADKVKLLSFQWLKANMQPLFLVIMTGGCTLCYV